MSDKVDLYALEELGLCPFCIGQWWNFETQACESCGECAVTV